MTSCRSHIVAHLRGLGGLLNAPQFPPPFRNLRASFAVCSLPASFIVQSTRNLEENPWMIYCKLSHRCFLYLFISSQPERFIFPSISPLPILPDSECVFDELLGPSTHPSGSLLLTVRPGGLPRAQDLGVRPEFWLQLRFLCMASAHWLTAL